MRVWVCGNLCKRVLFVVTVWGIKLCVCSSLVIKPTLWSARGDRREARRRTVDGTGQPGVLLALERHLVPAQLVAVHTAVCVSQKICTTCQEQELQSHIGKLTFYRLLFERYLFCKRGSLSFACLLSRKQTALRPFEGRGRGKNCGSGCRLFFFFFVIFFFFMCCKVSASSVQHRKTTVHLLNIAPLHLLPTRGCVYLFILTRYLLADIWPTIDTHMMKCHNYLCICSLAWWHPTAVI